ncbi:MAG: phosphotransferase, partial [Pseudomonadota bacterium]
MQNPTPDNSLNHWCQILSQHWGINAELNRLPGERDLNFIAGGDRPCVLKVMHLGCAESLVDLQCKAKAHINVRSPETPIPSVIRSSKGADYCHVADEAGDTRIAWLIEAFPGETYASLSSHSPNLIHQIGACIGAIDLALQDFEHSTLEREYKWDLTQGEWIESQLNCLASPARVALIERIIDGFRAVKPLLNSLARVPIHNDVNNHNILVRGSLKTGPRLSGIIDFGDCCMSPRVCELAIAGAYIVLGSERPYSALSELIAGYHSVSPLSCDELELIWPLLKMRLAVSVVNSSLMAQENPDDPYVVISQQPAWEFLESKLVDEALIAPRLRNACGLPISDSAPRIAAWFDTERGNFANVIGVGLESVATHSLSVAASTCPQNPFNLTRSEAKTMGAGQFAADDVFLGHYQEPRLVY